MLFYTQYPQKIIFFNVCPELFRTFLFLASGHEEKHRHLWDMGTNSLSEQSILLDTPFFQVFSAGSCFSAGASPRFGFSPDGSQEGEWCFHLLHGPWQAGLSLRQKEAKAQCEIGRGRIIWSYRALTSPQKGKMWNIFMFIIFWKEDNA